MSNTAHLLTFLVVLGFNIWYLWDFGWDGYRSMFIFRKGNFIFPAFICVYAAWGIYNLLAFILL